MGLLLDNDVGVFATELPSGLPALKVHASCPYSSARPDRLLKKVEDSVWTIEYYAKEINDVGGSGRRRHTSGSSDDQAVIFKP